MYLVNISPQKHKLGTHLKRLDGYVPDFKLTLVLLNRLYHVFANSVDPDQLASEEANWSGSTLFAIKYMNI